MTGWDNPKADMLRLVRSWLCDKQRGRWLMVVDNADDASVFFQDVSQSRTADGPGVPQSELLSDFLPQSPNGSIVYVEGKMSSKMERMLVCVSLLIMYSNPLFPTMVTFSVYS